MQILGGLLFLSANRAAAAVEGARGVAAVGVFNTLALLLVYPAFGVAQAMQPLVAFNLGAARLDRVRALLGRALAANLAIGFTIAGAVCLAPRTMAALFTRSDLHLLELVERGVPWVMCSVALFGASATVSHYFLAMQRPQPAGLLLAGRQVLCAAAFALLPRFLGISGLYLAPLFADLPIALLSLYMMRSEWRRLPRAPGSEAAADYAAS
jgi:Na+-driven multidrug efflux pump